MPATNNATIEDELVNFFISEANYDLMWPECMQFTRVESYTIPVDPVHYATAAGGSEVRHRISRIRRGAMIRATIQWLDSPREFYRFLAREACGGFNTFRIDRSNLTELIPDWEYYSKLLPSNRWRFFLSDWDQGFEVKPEGVCRLNVDITLKNVLPEDPYQNDPAIPIISGTEPPLLP